MHAIGGDENTGVGVSALAGHNTFDGRAGSFGRANTAIGFQSLINNEGGNSNTATGSKALYWNKDGNYYTASGANAIEKTTSGYSNSDDGEKGRLSQRRGRRPSALL